jgi:electron transfer flavoprotein alpha/beta subunit
MTNKKKIEKQKKQKEQKLEWILREWDCSNIEEAIKLASKDKQLHYALREAGLNPPRPKGQGFSLH